MDNIVIVSGGFDPCHSGHLQLFEEAAKFGPLFVCLNSDDWLTRKKGKPFMNFEERKYLISSLIWVNQVVAMDDSDDTACDGIIKVYNMFKKRRGFNMPKIRFANGGDRKSHNVPEVELCEKMNIDLLWNVGGAKANSSSDLLEEWVNFKTGLDK